MAGHRPRSPLPLEEVVAVARQIAEALEAAHDKGIVHRALKPSWMSGSPRRSRASRPRATSPTRRPLSMMASHAGVILGTTAYMSPEQAKGFPADHRSDVFSFGTVVYEMLTGRQPFPGDTVPDVLAPGGILPVQG